MTDNVCVFLFYLFLLVTFRILQMFHSTMKPVDTKYSTVDILLVLTHKQDCSANGFLFLLVLFSVEDGCLVKRLDMASFQSPCSSAHTSLGNPFLLSSWWLHLGLFCRAVGTDKWWKPAICASILVALFIRHTHYLAFVRFDYGYNMKFNIATGAVFNNNNNNNKIILKHKILSLKTVQSAYTCTHSHTAAPAHTSILTIQS